MAWTPLLIGPLLSEQVLCPGSLGSVTILALTLSSCPSGGQDLFTLLQDEELEGSNLPFCSLALCEL